jgi:hypothetical protein
MSNFFNNTKFHTNVRSSRYVRRKNEREFILLLIRAWLNPQQRKESYLWSPLIVFRPLDLCWRKSMSSNPRNNA